MESYRTTSKTCRGSNFSTAPSAQTATDVRIVILTSSAGQGCDGVNLAKCPVPPEARHERGDHDLQGSCSRCN